MSRAQSRIIMLKRKIKRNLNRTRANRRNSLALQRRQVEDNATKQL